MVIGGIPPDMFKVNPTWINIKLASDDGWIFKCPEIHIDQRVYTRKNAKDQHFLLNSAGEHVQIPKEKWKDHMILDTGKLHTH